MALNETIHEERVVSGSHLTRLKGTLLRLKEREREREIEKDEPNAQPKRSPQPLDDSLLSHDKPTPHPRHIVQMLNESIVRAFNDRFLDFLSSVEGDLFGVLDEAGVGETEFSCVSEGRERRETREGGREKVQ